MKPSTYAQVVERWNQLKTLRDNQKPLWDRISNFVGINVDPDYAYVGNTSQYAERRDQFVDDPTAAISVNQAGDYLAGILWGTGHKVFDLVPSTHVAQYADPSDLQEYYNYATTQSLYHMNHEECGYTSALTPYCYDQIAFGTSGIGLFLNDNFLNGAESNALKARMYGVDNCVIDVGDNGTVDYMFASHHWRVNRIVHEFAVIDNEVDATLFGKLPQAIRDAYHGGDVNKTFEIVYGMMPRADYHMKMKGKRGTKYKGVWFCPHYQDGVFFKEEDYSERPVNIARMIVVRGEVWGRSSGTMLMSSITSVNYMVGTAIEIIEKMASPALGVFSNAVFGDSVLNASADGLTVFNSALSGGGKPVFSMYDVGDPSSLVQFLVPYLNDKITTAFKIDALLDFNNSNTMTATEALQRSTIRGQSLAGILTRQKQERLIPDIKRAVSLLMNVGELGVNPATNPDAAQALRLTPERIIPEAVRKVISEGKPWYEIRFNNEMERLLRTEEAQLLLQTLQAVLAVAQVYPEIIQAVNWFKLVEKVNSVNSANNGVMLSEAQFRKKIEEMVAAQAAQAAQQAQGQEAMTAKALAEANRADAQAQKARQ